MPEKLWNLKEKPFEFWCDTRFFYPSASHNEALSRISYSVAAQSIMVLTGEYGCGKTLVSKVAAERLAAAAAEGSENFETISIFNPRLTATEFIKQLVINLDGEARSNLKVDLINELRQRLLNNFKARRKTVLFVDDTQAVQDNSIFDEIRLLTCLEEQGQPLLNIILLGQTELRGRIKQIKQLEQRVGLWYHLAPLFPAETEGYIRHRLQTAGASSEIFSKEAFAAIHQLTEGIPRLINNLCQMSLIAATAAGQMIIDDEIVRQTARSLKG